ncbi:hydroxyacylglutathione hydrolase [Spathaspora passalidarum NRRL Y-27907]|uniref:hydroxyacylglutathione hydrolase n=1 Tax=Spathaspora passalidarum (strain NRRL Y-27907 / 11-Y1) TaxID=619300 RepID=G3AM69_SPAPN|nr:hydroxyacylglutathione hydrolase [Spathaspora passalidarum NRRL Y-27907]EGW32775.1 hydroxyacylglutathione hydrolase [Spathaspora passalidarum NRRL Y-27907]
MFRQFIRNMQIKSIPMRWGRGDNYAYLIIDTPTKHAWIIDPAQPEDISKYLDTNKTEFELKAIVNTHHHYDHSDGNKHYHKQFPGLPVIAGRDSPLVTYTPLHGEVIDLGENVQVTALYTPCHTQDSICYYVEDKETKEKAVFTGDTLFISGCGRFFEGDGVQMDHALNGVLAHLPKDTRVFPGHEYTKSNVKFSKTVLNNDAIASLEKFANENEFTTGKFTIADELKFNPFMMLTDPQVQKATGLTKASDVITKLREMKNNF